MEPTGPPAYDIESLASAWRPSTPLREAVYCLSSIRTRIAEHRPQLFPAGENTREAAVAVILRPDDADTRILFIKRAEKRGDPWSGHMAFPGGHREPRDPDLRSAAERETLEEIGLDLERAEYLGPLDHQRAMPAAAPSTC